MKQNGTYSSFLAGADTVTDEFAGIMTGGSNGQIALRTEPVEENLITSAVVFMSLDINQLRSQAILFRADAVDKSN